MSGHIENMKVKVFYEHINVPMKIKGHIQKILKEHKLAFYRLLVERGIIHELVFTCIFFFYAGHAPPKCCSLLK